jgi:serine/threonine-protein kinase SRPK3
MHRDLKNLLIQKYDFTDDDADGFSNYLLPMLDFDPKQRTTARLCADHAWVAGVGSL